MTYCSTNEKAIVSYSFKDGIKKNYETTRSPIQVVVNQIPIPASAYDDKGGYCNAVIYRVDFILITTTTTRTYQNKYSATVYGPVLDVRGLTYDPTKSSSPGYQILCRGLVTFVPGTTTPNNLPYPDIRWYVQGVSAGGYGYIRTEVDSKSVVITRLDQLQDNCKKPPYLLCELTITLANRTRFVDSGECPCNFTVQCGDCPEGTLRCDCPSDPRGYCCLPCTETITSISSITNLLKALNNG